MEQELSSVEFGTTSISKFTGRCVKTIAMHCRTGKLKAYRKTEKGDYHILVEDFVSYLARHPTALNHYRTLELKGYNRVVQTYILEQLKTYPRYFSVQEIADTFGVTKRTVWNWVHEYDFKPDLYESDQGTHKVYFLTKTINSLLLRVPRIRNIYIAYNKKRKAS